MLIIPMFNIWTTKTMTWNLLQKVSKQQIAVSEVLELNEDTEPLTPQLSDIGLRLPETKQARLWQDDFLETYFNEQGGLRGQGP